MTNVFAAPDAAKAEMVAVLRARFGAHLRVDEPLARHCTFGVGGPADAWVQARAEQDLIDLVRIAAEHGWPLMLAGNGTNTLYADAGARGIVVQNGLNDWELVPLAGGQALIHAGAGVNLPALVNRLAVDGWGGLEFGAGIPGSLGGAIVSNAGAHGRSLSDVVQQVRVLEVDPDRQSYALRAYAPVELQLAYRHSRFRARRTIRFDEQGRPLPPRRHPIEPLEMIVGMDLVVWRTNSAAVQMRVAQYKQHRKETQPPQPSAGSVFKNPPGDYAGRLVEEAGLKGARAGQAQISPRHANFIVNLGGARATDIVQLIALARRTVLERFGIALELEVEFRGDWTANG
jgi:UDP-N-acetylmuramate dehydrogenase